MEKRTTEIDIEKKEKAIQTPIAPNDESKEICKEDLDGLINLSKKQYSDLGALIVDSMQDLEILKPVVKEEQYFSIETKFAGLSKNFLKLEGDLKEVIADSEAIDALITEKNNDTSEETTKRVDLELIPKYEMFIFNIGTLTKNLDALTEYYFTNLKSVVEDLANSAKRKHEILQEKAKQEEAKETKILEEK